MNAIKHTVSRPVPEIAIDRGGGRKILRQLPPLAARAIDVASGIEDLAHIRFAFAPAAFLWRNHRLDDRPLGVAAITRIPAAARLVHLTLLLRPHGGPLIRLP